MNFLIKQAIIGADDKKPLLELVKYFQNIS